MAKILATAVAVVGLVGGLIAIWAFTPVQDAVCRRAIGQHLQAICPDNDRTVTKLDATPVILAYFHDLTQGDGPRASWSLLGTSAAATTSYESVAELSSALYWAQVRSITRLRGAFNAYEVDFRFFYKGDVLPGIDEGVIEYKREFRMAWNSGAVQIAAWWHNERVNSPINRNFVSVRYVKPENIFEEPTTAAHITQYPVTPTHDGDVHLNGILTALCNTEDPGPIATSALPVDAGWWVRVPQGWVKSEALSVDTSEATTPDPVPGIPLC